MGSLIRLICVSLGSPLASSTGRPTPSSALRSDSPQIASVVSIRHTAIHLLAPALAPRLIGSGSPQSLRTILAVNHEIAVVLNQREVVLL